MSLKNITDRQAVQSAINECRSLGRDAFLKKYGYGKAHGYFVEENGELFDSKAILAAAHRYQFPDIGPLKYGTFGGGKATVQPVLARISHR